MKEEEPQIPDYEGYRRLKSFRMAQLVYNVTMQFCDRYIDEESRTYTRMMQAARNGAQKIADGSHAGETSKMKELKLTRIARTNLEDLQICYGEFLQKQELPLWDEEDPRRAGLIAMRPRRAEDVEQWVVWVQELHVPKGPEVPPGESETLRHEEAIANGALALIARTVSLIDRQLSSQKRSAEHEERIADQLRRKHQSKKG